MVSDCLRVLQYVRVLDNGGIESLIFNLLNKTNRRIVNYDFLVTRNRKESYDSKIEEYGCKKIIVCMPNTGFLPIRYYKCYKLAYDFFKDSGYDVVHFQSIGTSFGGSLALFAAKKANIPVRIVHAHSNYYRTSIIRKIDQEIGRWAHRKWGTHFMACSEGAAEFSFGKNCNDRLNVTYVKNGIDTDKFAFNRTVRDKMRDELKLTHKFVLGSIGRLSIPKNHKFMIEVLEKLLELRKDAVLVIVGGMSTGHEKYANSLRHYVEEKQLQEKVIFTGERNDAYKIINVFDAYLFPSLWEGLGIAAIEAQTNGLDVFASSVIPKETELTDKIHYLSLEEGSRKWAEYINNFNYTDNRKNYSRIIKDAGYDIKTSAHMLEDFYINAVNLNNKETDYAC